MAHTSSLTHTSRTSGRLPHLRDSLIVAKVGFALREPLPPGSIAIYVNNAGKSRPPKTTRSILTQRSIMRKRIT